MKSRVSRPPAKGKKTSPKPAPRAQALHDKLGPIIKGFERRAAKGDAIAARTAKVLRSARAADVEARALKPRVIAFAHCSGCGDNIAETTDPRRPGGTAVHHLKNGNRCPGSDLPLAAHAEVIAQGGPRSPLATLLAVGLFGPLEQAVA